MSSKEEVVDAAQPKRTFRTAEFDPQAPFESDRFWGVSQNFSASDLYFRPWHPAISITSSSSFEYALIG